MRRSLVLLALAALAAPAVAQDAPTVEALSRALRADQEAHLWRVGAWGLANVVGGTVLFVTAHRDRQSQRGAFGLQAAAWGAINTGIAVVGLASGPGEVVGDWATALAAENGYADVLLINLGLNVGYAAVGATLWAVSGRGVSRPAAWRGHGQALVVQGLGLLVLDGIATLGTRTRLDALVDLAASASLGPTADGLTLAISL